MLNDNGSSSSNPILALQDYLDDLGYKKNRPFLTELLALTPNDILLDIGGGTGMIIDQILGKSSCQGYIVEVEQKKLLYAARKRKNINLVNASADFIPFPYDCFSKVMSIVAFHHFSDQDSALEEIKRVLKPGGLLILNEIDPSTFKGKIVSFGENTVKKMNCKYYSPSQLHEKVKAHAYQEITITHAPIGYFLSARKSL
jgi:ubiquinone/menaquinone biosynthesis C-methylase UbiE